MPDTRIELEHSPNTTYLHAGLFWDGGGNTWVTHAPLRTNEVPGVLECYAPDGTALARYLVWAGEGVKTDMLKCAIQLGTGNIVCYIGGHTVTQPRVNVRALVTLHDVAVPLPVASGRALPDPGPQVFTDVPPSDPFYGPIHQLARMGVVSGYGDTYRPGAGITRAQLAKMLIGLVRWLQGP